MDNNQNQPMNPQAQSVGAQTGSLPQQPTMQAAAPAADPQPIMNNPTSDPPKSSSNMILWIIIGIIIIAIIGGGVYYYLNMQKQSVEQQVSDQQPQTTQPTPKPQDLESELESMDVESGDEEFNTVDKDLQTL